MQGYTDALLAFRWTEIHEAAKKEASRQIGLMNRWLKWAEETSDDELTDKDNYWVRDAIKKAGKHQFNIYNRNKQIKEIDRKLKVIDGKLKDPKTDPDTKKDLIAEATVMLDEKAELESEQATLANRILRIFCRVHGTVTLSNGNS